MKPVSDVIFTLFQGTPHQDEWLLACLTGAWSGMLGEPMGRVCRPQTVRGGRLVVQVLDSAWLPVLTGMHRELLERIRAATGCRLERVTFVAGDPAAFRPPAGRGPDEDPPP